MTLSWFRIPFDMFLAILLMDGERNIRLVQRISGSCARRLPQTLQPTYHLCSEADPNSPTSASLSENPGNNDFHICEAYHRAPSCASLSENPGNNDFHICEAYHRAPSCASLSRNPGNHVIHIREAYHRPVTSASVRGSSIPAPGTGKPSSLTT